MCPVHEADSNRAEHHLIVYSRPADITESAPQPPVSFRATLPYKGRTRVYIGAHKKAGHIDIKQSLERQVILP